VTRLADLPATVDLLIIGAGTAGLVAAKTAAGFGADTLLVEAHRTGGDCLWTGCVPSKSLIAAAEIAQSARDGSHLGVHVDGIRVDFAAVMAHVHGAMATIAPVDSPETIEQSGARVVIGRARFTGPRRAEIDGRPIAFRQAVIATGSAPTLPHTPGMEGVSVLTSDTVWDLTTLPERLVVIGGGAIGCELGQAFARLGSRVVLVQRGPRLLPKEDENAARIVTAALEDDGVDVRLSTEVVRVEANDDGESGILHLVDGTSVPFDRLLAALGRFPRTEGLGLDAAEVRTTERGHVIVDRALRTSNPRIWAAGDVSGLPQFTHTAGVNGSVAATNAVLGLRRTVSDVVPRVTFTHPEVAAVGLQPSEAAANGCSVQTVDHTHVDRAIVDDRTTGFTSLVIDGRGRLRGALIVGPRAGESLGEASLAVSAGLKTNAIASATHAYPTYSDALFNAAVADVRERLQSGALNVAVRALSRVRSWRVR